MERISKYQLGAMIIIFEIGSTPLFELGINVKQDAWLVVLSGILSGLLLLRLFMSIQRREPDKNFFQIMTAYLGPWAGKLFVCAYILFFVYESSRNVRDFGELTIMTMLPQAPISLIMLIMLVLSCYALYKGMEVFFRVAEILVPGVLLAYALLMIMYFISGDVELDHLLPILENGINPVLKESFKGGIWFPFGQTLVFLVFWNHLAESKTMGKTSVYAYLISAAVIFIMNILNLAVLGPHYADISTIPLLQSIQLIQIADVFERFDPFVILLFYTGILIKATVWFLAALLGLKHLFRTDYRKFILPAAAAIYAVAFPPDNWQSHLDIGRTIYEKYQANPAFLLGLPLLLYIVMLIRGNSGKREAESPVPPG